MGTEIVRVTKCPGGVCPRRMSRRKRPVAYSRQGRRRRLRRVGFFVYNRGDVGDGGGRRRTTLAARLRVGAREPSDAQLRNDAGRNNAVDARRASEALGGSRRRRVDRGGGDEQWS